MVVGIHTHLDDMLASQYQSIDWTKHTACLSDCLSLGDGIFLRNNV